MYALGYTIPLVILQSYPNIQVWVFQGLRPGFRNWTKPASLGHFKLSLLGISNHVGGKPGMVLA